MRRRNTASWSSSASRLGIEFARRTCQRRATEVSAALITVPAPPEARRRRVARRPQLVALEAPPPALAHSCGHLVTSCRVAVIGGI